MGGARVTGGQPIGGVDSENLWACPRYGTSWRSYGRGGTAHQSTSDTPQLEFAKSVFMRIADEVCGHTGP